ncbi:MAG: hypothetical protein H6813_01385 [Phycisphaeraceae bacterium]|nr:hypothetical protein [Phycisphaeraceae bacterium]
MRRTHIPSLIFALTALGGCVSASDTGAVARAQAQAVERLAVESAVTNAALRSATNTLLMIRVERIASDAEQAIIADLLTAGGEPDHAALDAMLKLPQVPANPLATMVREARLTPDDAHAWLDTYAATWRATGAAPTRRRLLESLHPVALARDEAATLSAALRDRAESDADLFADASRSAHALTGAAQSDPDLDALYQAATDSWRELLLERIDSPEQRAAARRLLDSVLNLGADAGEIGGAQ